LVAWQGKPCTPTALNLMAGGDGKGMDALQAMLFNVVKKKLG
jgi:predicted RNA-binding protein Jag